VCVCACPLSSLALPLFCLALSLSADFLLSVVGFLFASCLWTTLYVDWATALVLSDGRASLLFAPSTAIGFNARSLLPHLDGQPCWSVRAGLVWS
jgi:hypothetical protein